MTSDRPLLAATLIVRDEEADLADCLASLAPAVDEMVVYDTGSRDGSVELARRGGARVVTGYWDGDFARARTESLRMTDAQWALIVDADERLVADAHVLRRLLLGTVRVGLPVDELDAFAVAVVSRGEAGTSSAHASLRLVRPDRGHWVGRVHETFSLVDPARTALLPAAVAVVEHLGYTDAARVRAKGERNLALAQAELDALIASRSEDRDAGARVLFDLARSYLVLDRRQEAVDALEMLREVCPAGPRWAAGTALLAQVLLDAGGFEDAALVLEAQLRESGTVDPRLADWLRAQAVGRLGDGQQALALLRGIDAMADPFGTPQPLTRVHRARALLAAEFGQLAEARHALELLRGPGGAPVTDVLAELAVLRAS